MNEGWIKIHRKIYENPRSNDPEWMAVWLYLLLNATHREYDVIFKGQRTRLKAGELITGRRSISINTGVNESKVKRILKSLKTDQQIEQQTSNLNSLISITKWDQYQNIDQQSDQQVTSKRPASDQQVATNKNDNNIKNNKNEINDIDSVPLDEPKELEAESDFVLDSHDLDQPKKKTSTFPSGYLEHAQKLYNEICTTLPQCRMMTDSRKQAVRMAYKRFYKIDPDFVEGILNQVNESKFLSGRDGKWKGCNFDWIFKPQNLIKIAEGNYDDER